MDRSFQGSSSEEKLSARRTVQETQKTAAMQMIVDAALLSHAVYRYDSVGHGELTAEVSSRFGKVHVSEVAHARVMLVEDGDRLWVVYCGTNQARDWMDNLDSELCRAEFVDGHIHRGFEVHARLLDHFVDRVARDAGPLKELICVGHSLGSALATRTGVRYATEWGSRVRVIGFATPRVFDCVAAYVIDHVLQIDVARVNILSDLIDHVPAHAPDRYCHVGKSMFLDSFGRVTSEERHLLMRAGRLLWQWSRMFFPWNAHSMKEYRRRIEAWCEYHWLTGLHWTSNEVIITADEHE